MGTCILDLSTRWWDDIHAPATRGVARRAVRTPRTAHTGQQIGQQHEYFKFKRNQQHEYFEFKRNLFSAWITGKSINVAFLKLIISVQDGHCDHPPRTSKNLVTPLPHTSIPVPTTQEGVWAPKPVCTLQKREKSLLLPRTEPRFHGRLSRWPVTILTKHSRYIEQNLRFSCITCIAVFSSFRCFFVSSPLDYRQEICIPNYGSKIIPNVQAWWSRWAGWSRQPYSDLRQTSGEWPWPSSVHQRRGLVVSSFSRLIDALLSAVEISKERERDRERQAPSCTGDFNAPPLDDLVEPVNCTWIPYHGRDLFPWKTSGNRRLDARWFLKAVKAN